MSLPAQKELQSPKTSACNSDNPVPSSPRQVIPVQIRPQRQTPKPQPLYVIIVSVFIIMIFLSIILTSKSTTSYNHKSQCLGLLRDLLSHVIEHLKKDSPDVSTDGIMKPPLPTNDSAFYILRAQADFGVVQIHNVHTCPNASICVTLNINAAVVQTLTESDTYGVVRDDISAVFENVTLITRMRRNESNLEPSEVWFVAATKKIKSHVTFLSPEQKSLFETKGCNIYLQLISGILRDLIQKKLQQFVVPEKYGGCFKYIE